MSKCIVLTENSVSETFESHDKAFNHCENLKPKLCKGVYLMLDDKTLYPLNIFGGWSSQNMMESIHNDQFNFKVI